MSSSPEIVTLQLGSFSNFIGSHFWNIQQEEANIAYFKESDDIQDTHSNSSFASPFFYSYCKNTRSNTISYRPRLVLSDLSGALGGCSDRSLCDSAAAITTPHDIINNYCWDETNISDICDTSSVPRYKHPYLSHLDSDQYVDQQKRQKLNTSPFKSSELINHQSFDFENTVQHFNDYFIPEWTPQDHSVLIPGYFHQTDSFDSYSLGHHLTTIEEPDSFYDQLINKCRHEFEKCDKLTAIHLLVDWLTSYGPIGTACIQWIKEQCPKVPLVVFGWQNLNSSMDQYSTSWNGSYRRIAGGLFVQECLEDLLNNSRNALFLSDFNIKTLQSSNSSVSRVQTIPNFNLKSNYLASALPAVAMDCAIYPYKANLNDCNPQQLFETINFQNQYKSLMCLQFNSSIPAELFNTFPGSNQSSLLYQQLYDLRVSPFSHPSFKTSDKTNQLQESTQSLCIKGLTTTEYNQLHNHTNLPYCSMHFGPYTPVPIPFPQTVLHKNDHTKDITQMAMISRITADLMPGTNPVFQEIGNQINRVLNVGKSAILKDSETIERDTVLDIQHFFHTLLDCQLDEESEDDA